MSIILDLGTEGLIVGDIVRRVEFLLNDHKNVRWTLPELFDWINDAGNAVVVKLPTARAITASIPLQGGALQSLESSSSDAILLLDVTRNMMPDGTVGRAIRIVDRQLLDDQEPDWYLKKRSGRILHYTFDERSPRTFYVYPPAIDGTMVEVLYSERPPQIAHKNDSLDLSNQYIEAVVNYVCFRALSKEAEEGMPAMAAAYYQAFINALDIDAQTEAIVSPNGASQ